MKRLALWVLAVFFIILTLSGCSGASPTALPTVVLGSNNTAPQAVSSPALSTTPGSSSAATQASALITTGGGVSASGIVVPAHQAQMASALGGMVKSVDVAVGNQVKAGQVLVRLAGSEKLEAEVEAANLQLLTAQQALQTLNTNADQARTDAQVRLANAQKALNDAQTRRGWMNYRNGSQSAIDAAQANLILAENALQTAKDNYSSVANLGETNINRAAALSALAVAQNAYDKDLVNLNYLLALPNKIDLDQAQAALDAAKAEVANAQQAYDNLQSGPDPNALALAQEQIKNAQAQITASQSDLANLDLVAPFDGTVSRIDINNGEYATAGQTVLVLADLNHLQVQTTDLSERDVPRVKTGQAVSVLVKALGQNINGHVSDISPLADSLGGDVVYQTTIDLDSSLPDLRAGMSVTVTFGQ
ncbi:MAG: HlyD family efflux transporter periplasmic adaptor subunit [Anaerolineaceae bacterium]|nr:HlyD family efflux transporter periplasmic adaptor subunit [Anaerolineaceae bacterium]